MCGYLVSYRWNTWMDNGVFFFLFRYLWYTGTAEEVVNSKFRSWEQKQEARVVNKSQNEDPHQPLWGHSLRVHKQRAPVNAEKGTTTSWWQRPHARVCDSAIRTCPRFQPPFFPQLTAFLQCTNHATIHGGLGKSKGIGEMCSIWYCVCQIFISWGF